MAKKTRKQKQRAARRQQTGTGTTAVTLPPASTAVDDALAELDGEISAAVLPASAQETPVPVPAPAPSAVEGRRRIERLTPAAAARASGPPPRPGRGPANAAAMFQPLETDDAAIPFDRVPYVPSDLRRVALIAAAMIVLIVIAAIIVSHVVT